ncbi:MAG: hypothetical protein J1F11_10210 [Oscillospiraceae bacterium]|nr:hypothetical protein [Oscillospiraceae bacterium]
MDFFNFIKDGFSSFVEKLIDVLPKSPITYISANPDIRKILGYVNYFIPIYSFISILEVWLVAILIYYVVQVILRWLKVIE